MSPSFLLLWQCPACRHLWRGYRWVVCDSNCPECGGRDIDASTWCTSEDDGGLLTAEEMEEVIDCQLQALLEMRRGYDG